jgi:hypothetical protein
VDNSLFSARAKSSCVGIGIFDDGEPEERCICGRAMFWNVRLDCCNLRYDEPIQRETFIALVRILEIRTGRWKYRRKETFKRIFKPFAWRAIHILSEENIHDAEIRNRTMNIFASMREKTWISRPWLFKSIHKKRGYRKVGIFFQAVEDMYKSFEAFHVISSPSTLAQPHTPIFRRISNTDQSM